MREPKLTPLALLVIWGSRELTLGEKVVWYRDWTLDPGGPDGCYASAKGLSESLGGSLTPASIDTIRHRLGKLDLQVTFKRVEGRNPGRICTLPGTISRPRTAQEATRFCAVLDQHIADRDRGPVSTQVKTTLNPDSDSRAGGLSGGVGGVSSASKSVSSTPSSSFLPSEKKGTMTTHRTARSEGEPSRVSVEELERKVDALRKAAGE